ncbi:phosphatase PAP2 family protein [Chitinophaga sp. 30R24]|uniref:phosphatase PAP2 family protein n=1 Tax=Chitinophaga sp. 30R24 TaxID=3248838 RepID=UPI003B918016
MQAHAISDRNEDTPSIPEFSPMTRSLAQVISYITHPLFLPLLVTFLILNSIPEYMVTFKSLSKRFAFDSLYFRVGITCIGFPALVLFLTRALNLVSSVYMKTQRDRIIPYSAMMIFYFWAFYTFQQEGLAPRFYTAFFLGAFLSISIAFVSNVFIKTSMHTVGWGGVIGFLLSLMWGMHMNVSIPLVITFFVAALVATARMVLGAHTPREIYAGFLIGILCQLISCWILVK